MKVERVEVRLLELPLVHPFETSFGRMTTKRFLLVSVSAGGVTGYGECTADRDPSYLPETNATVLHVLRDFLAPLLLSREIDSPHALLGLFDAHVRGHRMAKAALEMAVWELWARREGVPLARLLGGTKATIPAGVSIGLQPDVETLLDKVALERAAGYQRVKIKIAPGRDVALVSAVRERFGDLPLMVDANSAYGLGDIDVLRALDAHDLTMIEQPLGWDDMVDHAVLQRELRTPICLDESIGSPDDARRALAIGAARVINVKVGRVGGFAASRRIAQHCAEHDVPVWCGGMLESGIGRLANVHLQTLPGFTLPGDTAASARYFAEDLVDPPVSVAPDGTIAVPTAPGIGHEIVWSRVERATRHREEWTG